MNCPHDKRRLSLNDRHAFTRRECRKCGGMLLDESFLMLALSKAQASGDGRVDLLKLPESKIACPHDRQRMRAVLHGDVEVDICPHCRSVWLDRSEYDKIVAIEKIKKQDQAARYVAHYTDKSPIHYNLGDVVNFVVDVCRGTKPDPYK